MVKKILFFLSLSFPFFVLPSLAILTDFECSQKDDTRRVKARYTEEQQEIDIDSAEISDLNSYHTLSSQQFQEGNNKEHLFASYRPEDIKKQLDHLYRFTKNNQLLGFVHFREKKETLKDKDPALCQIEAFLESQIEENEKVMIINGAVQLIGKLQEKNALFLPLKRNITEKSEPYNVFVYLRKRDPQLKIFVKAGFVNPTPLAFWEEEWVRLTYPLFFLVH